MGGWVSKSQVEDDLSSASVLQNLLLVLEVVPLIAATALLPSGLCSFLLFWGSSRVPLCSGNVPDPPDLLAWRDPPY